MPKSLTYSIINNVMKSKIENQIKQALYTLLKEQSEEEEKTQEIPKRSPKKSSKNTGLISTAGAFGSGGRVKRFVAEAGARSKTDPDGLMEDLGIKDSASGPDLDAALKILKIAIYSNPVMSEAYTGVKLSTDILLKKDSSENLDVIGVTPGSLDRKNAVRFLAHTLVGAQNAGYLDLEGGLQFGQGQRNSIIIYSI